MTARTATLHKGKGYAGDKLDSYDAPTGSVGSGTCYGCGSFGGAGGAAWVDALPEVRKGCRTVPSAIGHGYPEADYAQDGDWRDADADAAADQQGYGSGYYGYGYGYNGGTWSGHGGAGSNWDALALTSPNKSAHFAIVYDAQGRMVAESLVVEPVHAASKTPRHLLRKRSFASGGLGTDRVFLAAGLEVRALQFLRDAQGHLIRRELTVLGQVAEFATWQRDAAGRSVGHTRAGQAKAWQVLAASAISPDVVVPPALPLLSQTRVFDAAGRVVEQRVVVPGAKGATSHHTRAFDSAGRKVAQMTDLGSGQTPLFETWAFDAAGREVVHTQRTSTQDVKQNWYTARTFAANGLPASVEQGHDLTLGAKSRQTFVYGCE